MVRDRLKIARKRKTCISDERASLTWNIPSEETSKKIGFFYLSFRRTRSSDWLRLLRNKRTASGGKKRYIEFRPVQRYCQNIFSAFKFLWTHLNVLLDVKHGPIILNLS